MIEHVRFTPEAETDVCEAYNWYEDREPGLGEEFLRCVEACLLHIRRHPLLFPVAVDEFRRCYIRRFPYEIFYEVGEGIVVYSVFHCAQNPDKWRKRLGGT